MNTEKGLTEDKNVIADYPNQFIGNLGKNLTSNTKEIPDFTTKLNAGKNSIFLELTTGSLKKERL